jgi:hypothetical protein
VIRSALRARTIRSLGAGLALAGAIALSGCTSSKAGSDSGSPAPGTASLTAITPIPGSDTSTPQSSSPAPSSSTAPSKTPTSTLPPKPTPTGPLECTSEQLKTRALRGSAAAGQEFALITFTNTSPLTCTMVGFPGVSLRLHNALLGKAAQRSATPPKTVTLKPGQQAESTLTDFSSCQAPVSDTVRVYAPDQRPFVDLPLVLRGCRVVVDPVTHS